MVPSATQRKMTSKAGPLVEVPVEIGGANGDSPGKSVEMDEDEETMTVQDSVVTGEPTITTFTAWFVEVDPEEAEGIPT